jgi:D-alanyl-D-alanine carboxypeptidase/D-alanyl-D-alanine-endopeptidase (penicillin-binding protein 4)
VLPNGCSTASYLALMEQADYTGALLVSLWQQLGGTLTGQIREGLHPRDNTTELLATTSSRDLVTMVRDINKWSNNVMVRQVYLTLGAENRQPTDADDLAAADRTIREWLARKGVDDSAMIFENGSGLSRKERITARQMASLLQHAWESRFSAELIASLPLVAMDGTMRRRLGHADMAGMGHIKTGSLKNVRSIAGFTRDENNTTWAVVAMINDNRAWGAEAVLDELIEQVHLAARQQDVRTAGQ